MQKEYVLVLGSKPNSIIPNVRVSNIYSANAAAERAAHYKKKFPKTYFSAIVGSREFLKNIEVHRRVINSNPDLLITRSGKINFRKYFDNNTNYEFFSTYDSLFFQSNFFNFGLFDIIFAEFKYEAKIFNKFLYLLKGIKNLNFNGTSTGFFSILYALKKHPESEIIISGIGIKEGGYFYNTNKKDLNLRGFTNRANVDRKLILCLKKQYKKRLITTDKFLASYGNIRLWK